MSNGKEQPKFSACIYILNNVPYPTHISSYMQPVSEVIMVEGGRWWRGKNVRTFWYKRVLQLDYKSRPDLPIILPKSSVPLCRPVSHSAAAWAQKQKKITSLSHLEFLIPAGYSCISKECSTIEADLYSQSFCWEPDIHATHAFQDNCCSLDLSLIVLICTYQTYLASFNT